MNGFLIKETQELIEKLELILRDAIIIIKKFEIKLNNITQTIKK